MGNLLGGGGEEHVGAVEVVWVVLRVAWGIEPDFHPMYFRCAAYLLKIKSVEMIFGLTLKLYLSLRFIHTHYTLTRK